MDTSIILEFLGSLGPTILYPSIFIVAVFFVFILFINSEAISKNAPGILISLGILITFIGITIALINFDPQNITQTIPELLEGLKLAFISSIVGLITSILYRILSISFKGIKRWIENKKSSDELTAKHFYDQIENINRAIKEGNDNIKEALTGEGDASLSTQIAKLRNDFRDFAEKVAEAGTEQLIKALEQVIKDFNQQINEQFGENFQALNAAVEKLVVWQEEYKNQVERLTELFKTAQEGIQLANESIDQIKESTSQIPQHMETLQTAFDTTNSRMKELYEGLGSLAQMKENAEQAIPTIERHLNQIFNELQTGAQTQREAINQSLADIQNLQQSLNNQIQKSMQRINEQIETHLSNINTGLQHSADEQQKIINNSLEGLRQSQQEVSDTMNEHIKGINEQVANVNREMEKYITGALQTMGNNLAPIAQKLVEDYQEHQQIISDELTRLNQRFPNQ